MLWYLTFKTVARRKQGLAAQGRRQTLPIGYCRFHPVKDKLYEWPHGFWPATDRRYAKINTLSDGHRIAPTCEQVKTHAAILDGVPATLYWMDLVSEIDKIIRRAGLMR